MKKNILSFLLIFVFITNTVIAQETSSTATTTEETVQSFCKELGKAIAANDETQLNSIFPTVDELIAFMEASGVTLPPDLNKKFLNERLMESLEEYQGQVASLRYAAKQQNLDWNKMKIGEIKVKEVTEILDDDDENDKNSFTAYEIEINLTFESKRIVVISNAVFKSPSGLRIGEISDWKIKD